MNKFNEKYMKNEYGYIVGKISSTLAKLLNSKTQSVILSYDTLIKNLKHHPDLTQEEYLLLDKIIGKSHFIAQDGKHTLAIILEHSKLYHYTLKITKTGKAIFLTSFRRTNEISIEKIRKKDKKGKVRIIKDHLP